MSALQRKGKLFSDTETDPRRMQHSSRRLKLTGAQKGAMEGSSISFSRILPGLNNMYSRVCFVFSYMQKRDRHTKSVSVTQRGCDTNIPWTLRSRTVMIYIKRLWLSAGGGGLCVQNFPRSRQSSCTCFGACIGIAKPTLQWPTKSRASSL